MSVASGDTMIPTTDPAPITERRFLVPFILITSLFFLWAFGVNLNDILIPHLKRAFGLSDFQSSYIQVAFFGGYFLAALPAGWLMERIGYKRGILSGLVLCAAGAVLFVPASSAHVYTYFLVALFVMACGQSFLEVAANPYATILGPLQSAERRLNFAQSFNAVGAVASPLVGRAFILTGTDYSSAQIAAMSAAQLEAYRASEASTVKGPYLVVAAIFVLVGAMIALTHLPEVHDAKSSQGAKAREAMENDSLFTHPHLLKGVVAQFFYVGAQVGVASFVIRYAQFSVPGMAAKTAAIYLLCHQIGFMLGRFIGSGMMKQIAASRLLAVFAGGSVVCAAVALLTSGLVPVLAVVLIGFFHSIMFPTIFALSIKNLGALVKRGSSLLVMAIIGGAVFPAIMGRISDATNIQRAFVVPLLCYAYILYFAVVGYKPAEARMISVAAETENAR
ncbi:MAG TPA: L-fucose:H+ symporter permease [Candidatus Acidoferrum sp.]|nr:L-fucose:H+ symporter permease [Candidatus Acidoferrum sp.]